MNFLRALTSRRLGLVGVGVLALFILLAIAAPLLSPHDPWEIGTPMLSPGWSHPLGTNDIGQDILSEIIYGARISLLICFIAAIVATFFGTLLGMLSGYYRKLDFTIMRIVDIFLVIPRFPLIIIIAAFLRPSPLNLILIFILFGWPQTVRIVRSQALTERNREYIDSARMMGAKDPYILRRYIFPNILPLALVQLIMEAAHVLLAESGLSFLGLGDPTAKSWGTILHYAFEYPTIFISDLWVRWMLPAGICITLTVLALTLVGHSLEEWANPRLKQWTPARL